MKKTNKYVKTRGQILALEQNHSKPLSQTLANQTSIKPSSAISNNTNPAIISPKRPKGRPRKIKKISKEQSHEQKQKKVKQSKQKIIKKYKKKYFKIPKLNSPVKQKYNKVKSLKNQSKIKLESSASKQANQVQHQTKIKGKSFKIKLGVSIPKKSKSLLAKHEQSVKKQTSIVKREASPSKNRQNSFSKQYKSINKQAKGSKSKITIANQDSPSQQNNSIKLESEAPKKKKGRPRKIIQSNVGTKIQERTLDEQKVLDQFVENAIKIRKIRNERQFFESFSRIIEYMRDSWEFGEISKMLKALPRPEDVLKIGIQVSRGIRKQLQIQAMNQAV